MRRRRLATAGVVLAAAWALRALPGEILVVTDPLPPSADAIVVLAGALESRAPAAADLFQAGIAPRIVVTRERLLPGSTLLRARGIAQPESDDLTIDVLERLGVPAAAIVHLRRRTYSTASEARTIARWACRHGIRRLVVVTGRSHSRRARLILERILPDVAISMRPTPYDGFHGASWYRHRHHAKEVLNEWQKLANHWVRERWGIEPCGGVRRRAGDQA